jgi:hypothetical protein
VRGERFLKDNEEVEEGLLKYLNDLKTSLKAFHRRRGKIIPSRIEMIRVRLK